MQMYEVGGCVRDELLGVPSKDIDFTVVLEGNEGPFLGADPFRKMEYELREMGFEIFLSTPEFLTVRARFPKGVGEIVTMRFVNGPPRTMDISGYKGLTADFVLARKESDYTDGRRPDVVEPGTLLDDLARRDFTMNAIAKDVDGTLIDPYGGQKDIENKVIRCVGEPMDRFNEDALRAVRAMRFAVTKGFSLSVEVHMALHDAGLNGIGFAIENQISDERICDELSKMFRFDTFKSIAIINKFPAMAIAMFAGNVSLDATMKTKGRGK